MLSRCLHPLCCAAGTKALSIPAVRNRRPQPRAQTSVARFGSESIANGGQKAYPIRVDSDTIDQISARRVNYQFAEGYVTSTLDDGQIWRQTADGQPSRASVEARTQLCAIIGRGGSAGYAVRLTGGWREIPAHRTL